MKDIKSQVSNFASNQRTRISIQLASQHPLIPIDQFDISEIFQVSHSLRSLESKQTTTNRNGRFAFVLRCKIDEAFKV
jgi:hypothetical protein